MFNIVVVIYSCSHVSIDSLKLTALYTSIIIIVGFDLVKCNLNIIMSDIVCNIVRRLASKKTRIIYIIIIIMDVNVLN